MALKFESGAAKTLGKFKSDRTMLNRDFEIRDNMSYHLVTEAPMLFFYL